MKKIFVLGFLLITLIANADVQSVDDVTLVVNGIADTKEEAIHIALRSAVEQAYGVFVSANTSIINDELVKDEIATVTSGNIKSFTELSSVSLPEGECAVTIQAVVSTQNLAAYAKSKGASCEFAGATFGANLKLIELNRINTKKAFDNLMVQLESMAPYIFDYELEVGNPSRSGEDMAAIPITVSIKSNENTVAFTNLLASTLGALSLSDPKAEEVDALGENLYTVYLWMRPTWGATGIWAALEPPQEASPLKFYYPFPIETLNNIIEKNRNNYCVKSNMGHTFLLEQEKKRCAAVYIWHNAFNFHLITLVNAPYGVKLYAGNSGSSSYNIYDERWGSFTCVVLPEFNDVKKIKTKIKGEKKKKVSFIRVPIELNNIETTIEMPIDEITKVSSFEIVKL